MIAKARTKAEEYGADPDMVEAIYREMILRFANIELSDCLLDKENIRSKCFSPTLFTTSRKEYKK